MPADDLDRDRLYSANAADGEGDDGDYQLEPVDPELIAAEQRRAAAAIDAHRTSIDVNEVYRDVDANRDSVILQDLAGRLRNFRFQFQVRHLLIATALAAVLLTLHKLGVRLFTVIAFLIMGGVAGLTIYLKWEENKRQEQADHRRQKMYAARRAHQARHSGQEVAEEVDDEPPLDTTDQVAAHSVPARQFQFKFSLQQLLLAVTGAAVLLGLVTMLGGAANAAMLCGLLALAGLAVPALGYRPPEIVVFGWWALLVLYVVLSLLAAVWASLGGA
jgi:Flp pilus assembly protein TadB